MANPIIRDQTFSIELRLPKDISIRIEITNPDESPEIINLLGEISDACRSCSEMGEASLRLDNARVISFSSKELYL